MIVELNKSFAIPGHVSFGEGAGGLTKVVVENEFAIAEVYLHGAHVTAYQRRGEQPTLWMSSESLFQSDRPIRGGVPICWPWFSHHPTDQDLPQHGFARTSPWTVVGADQLDDGATTLTLQLEDNDTTRALWPHAFRLVFTVRVGQQLSMELSCENTGEQPLVAGGALHTYFAVGQIEDVVVQGLAGRSYIDQLDNAQRKLQSGSLTIGKEVDRIYVDTEDEVVVQDRSTSRQIHVTKSGSRSTVVWNPWTAKSQRMPDFPDDGYKTMVCIETTNAADDVRTIEPNEVHVVSQTIHGAQQ